LVDFKEPWIFFTDFRKIYQYQILQNSSTWCPIVQCGRMDGQTGRHDEVDSCFWQFCEPFQKPTGEKYSLFVL